MASKKEPISKNPMVGTKIKAVPKPTKETGIDTKGTLESSLIDAALSSVMDISKLEGFTNVTQTREQVYKLIDTMSEDPILSSYLKTIAEDSVETNDSGQVVWCESADSKCAKYVSYLLESLNVDKNAYGWIYALYKYGDVYLKLYRESDYKTDGLFADKEKKAPLHESVFSDAERQDKDGVDLNEKVNLIVHGANDHYVHYVDMVPNPGEMFELTKFGKTMGYIKAPINIQTAKSPGFYGSTFLSYKMKQSDVDVYSATDFVHGCLADNSSRSPEEVDIFSDASAYNSEDSSKAYTYTVKRGQSELASVFKIWRQLSLLENSALLNRITKSSIIRTIQVNVGDMPKEQVQSHLSAVKNLMEQKAALNTDKSYAEYTNPGPMENNIYIPVRGENQQGSISVGTVGGDFDPKQLTDISYFQDKLFGALGIPKAFFGVTDDGAGFNGGASLAIQSSRYGKSVKRVQNTFCQMLTDLINLLLLDKGLSTYVNNFKIRMQAPVTQEELDRRENKKNRIGVVQDIMNQLADVENPIIKLKILKSLLSTSINDVDVIDLLQDQINELEKQQKGDEPLEAEEGDTPPTPKKEPIGEPMPTRTPPSTRDSTPQETVPSAAEEESETAPDEETPVEIKLPTPNDLGKDFTDNTQF